MKTTILFIFMSVLTCTINAGDSKYREAMAKSLEKLNHALSREDFQACGSGFERIALAEKNRWLPYYYASYAWIMVSFSETDPNKKDPILDKAQSLLDSAFAHTSNESEVHVLQALLYPSRIMVDPMNRGMLYMDKCFQSLESARNINPENPRIYFLLGTLTANIPESMGGGIEKARENFLMAQNKFGTFLPTDELMPVWGSEANEAELAKLPAR